MLATVVTTVVLTSGGGTGGETPAAHALTASPGAGDATPTARQPAGHSATASAGPGGAITTAMPLGKPLTGPIDLVNAVVFSSDSRTLAVGSGEGAVRLWDVSNPASGPGLIPSSAWPSPSRSCGSYAPPPGSSAPDSWTPSIPTSSPKPPTTLPHTVDDTRNVPYRASGGPTSGVFEVFVQHADGGGTVADG
ncbi:hypothetical protein BCD48_15865 [Pseudofrankia sp. BMG5.36]|nr:hypothetical protein BCD48_15865 [Pseudofrankia sp. BMG5.36]